MKEITNSVDKNVSEYCNKLKKFDGIIGDDYLTRGKSIELF